jgi:hypothetical protein
MLDQRRTVLIQFSSHSVRLDQNSSNQICCFKSDGSHCDMAIYTIDDLDDLADYIVAPLPSVVYSVKINE